MVYYVKAEPQDSCLIQPFVYHSVMTETVFLPDSLRCLGLVSSGKTWPVNASMVQCSDLNDLRLLFNNTPGPSKEEHLDGVRSFGSLEVPGTLRAETQL